MWLERVVSNKLLLYVNNKLALNKLLVVIDMDNKVALNKLLGVIDMDREGSKYIALSKSLDMLDICCFHIL